MASAPRLRLSSPQPPVARKEGGNDSLSPRLLGSTLRANKARTVLLSFDELPKWHQDNEFILHGYRPISGSAQVSFRSWSYIHNESVNIFSHLIPAIAFLLGEWYIQEYLTSRYSTVTNTDFFIFTFFLLTAIICLGLSTTYHTLLNHSAEVEQLWLRFDLVGIVILTLGDFVSGIYMVFWCEPLQRKIYWSMIGILGSLTIFIMLNPKFQGKKFRAFRAFAFVGTGLSGFAPLIHGVKMFGFSQMMKQSGMPYYLIEGGFLLLGALIYVTKFPESRYPGKFDIYGSSHQLFHILVVFATVTQLIGILVAFDYNYVNRTCSSL
ncbi:mpr-type gpcr [Trichoderma arundinaceum]|uniref:Mpr-type gpcr n=1 Tax=Trichoderma arundinaceum TaxID=490622 RepID=A0A395NWY8_TRIAR|nr:mpr-type gpcr [Trichoderma arundinaceum]